MEYPTTRGVTQYPTNTIRLSVLRRVASELFNIRGNLSILEVGSLYGDSARVLADFGQINCIDLWDWEDGLQHFIRSTHGCDINAIPGDSTEILPFFPDKVFDLIYIDGCHTYPIVEHDIAQAKRLIKEGGIICGDDLEKQITNLDELGHATNHKTIDFVDNYHPGVSLAVHDHFGIVNCEHGFWWTER